MKTNLYKILTLISLGTIMVVYTHCGDPFKGQTNLVFKSNVYDGPDSASYNAFETTVYPITRAHCINCHSVTQPLHASDSVVTAHNAVISGFKVNFANIPASRLVAKLRDDNHNCWSNCATDSAEMQAAIEDWKDAIVVTAPPVVPSSTVIKTLESRTLTQEFADNTIMKSNTVRQNMDASMVTSPMLKGTSSDGGYVWVPNDGTNATLANNAANAGRAYINFNVPIAGTYRVWGLVEAPNGNDNSMFVTITTANVTNRVWEPTAAATTEWRQVPNTFTLAAGNHTLDFRQREDGMKIFAVIVTSDAAFDGTNVNDFIGVTLSYSTPITGVQFKIDVTNYDLYSYKFSKPRVVTPTQTIRVKGVKVLLNNVYNPQHSTYNLVDKAVTPTDGSLSEYAMLVIKDSGPNIDKVSISFDQLAVETGGGTSTGGGNTTDSLTSYTATVYPISRTNCISCHTTQNPRHASDNNLTAHDIVINTPLVNFTTPENSRLVQKVRGGHNCGNTASCNAIGDAYKAAIEQWKLNR